jgi:hypothetical protein
VVDLEGVNLTDGPVSDKFLEALIRTRSGMKALAPVPYAQGELHVAGVGNRDTMGQFQIYHLQDKLNVHTEIAAEIVRDLKRKQHTAKRMERIRLPGAPDDEITR